jgi:hypothetical protein
LIADQKRIEAYKKCAEEVIQEYYEKQEKSGEKDDMCTICYDNSPFTFCLQACGH